MANVQDDYAAPAPIAMCHDAVVVAGGVLKAKQVVKLPCRVITGSKYWTISTHDSVCCMLLTVISACNRPLDNFEIWVMLRQAILTARKERAGGQLAGDVEEEAFDFAGEVAVAPGANVALATPQKRPRSTSER